MCFHHALTNTDNSFYENRVAADDLLTQAADFDCSRVKSPEPLRCAGDRKGQHSIRINKQWRVCFVWTQDGPKDVEIVDYHG